MRVDDKRAAEIAEKSVRLWRGCPCHACRIQHDNNTDLLADREEANGLLRDARLYVKDTAPLREHIEAFLASAEGAKDG